MAIQQIVGIQDNPKEEIFSEIWSAVLPKMKAWLEMSGHHKQKIKLEFIFKNEDMTNFELLSEVSQHDTFSACNLVEVDTPMSTYKRSQPKGLGQRVEDAEKVIKPLILEALAAKKRGVQRNFRIRVSIGSGSCRWVEKISGFKAPDWDG